MQTPSSPSAGLGPGWVEKHCPNIWALLNTAARRSLPPGIAKCLVGQGALARQDHLRDLDSVLARLRCQVGAKEMCRAYRRDLSGIGDEWLLANLWCELSLSAEVSAVAEKIVLRPRVNGKHSDLRAWVGGQDFWGEVKQLEDRWFHKEAAKPSRALSMRQFRKAKGMVAIPESEVIRQKLDGRNGNRPAPDQFPPDGIGVLFLFHSGSFALNEHWIRAALFGDAFALATGAVCDPEYAGEHDSNGLFLLQRWQRVSACCWVGHDLVTGRLRLWRMWHNPVASTPLPGEVCLALGRLC